ncbi:hypothetical protein [Rhodoferax sp.]|uniref:hypothetical protein n=1 Tax=Rhodoferax sp. TaxID=50421 RepID=UPI002ACDE964|nr:hypothetical protein [Rhodoferax sp.]MDZ7921195.1 hypothetical protein [Rhodoferax sp.]
MNDSEVAKIVTQRAIPEVLHFTTNNGLVGVLHTDRLSANAFSSSRTAIGTYSQNQFD